MHYFLNIGSNLGNRKLNISRALRGIEQEFGYFDTSKIVESKPWGFDSENSFMNAAVMVISDKTPTQVLDILKKIEHSIDSASHRTDDGKYADRLIDIDIMAADETMFENDILTIPHRHLEQRRFFLQPFAELAPLWRNPRNGLTCSEMLDLLPTE